MLAVHIILHPKNDSPATKRPFFLKVAKLSFWSVLIIILAYHVSTYHYRKVLFRLILKDNNLNSMHESNPNAKHSNYKQEKYLFVVSYLLQMEGQIVSLKEWAVSTTVKASDQRLKART